MDVVSTAGVPAGERFAFFREMTSKMWMPLDARCEPDLLSGFEMRAGFSGLGPVRAVLATNTPMSVQRTPELIRRCDPEAFFLHCAVRGRMIGEQDGRQADLGVGDLVLRNSSRPHVTMLAPGEPAGQVLILLFPRLLLPLSEAELRDLTAVRIPGDRGIGALSSQFLLQLARHMHELSPADTARLPALVLDVLTVALADALNAHRAVPSHTRRRALLAQVHAFIGDNLGDAHLTPAAIAAAHHISLRYLHKLFHDQGHTVAGWIRERRLERCRRDLADPRLAAHSISAIAAQWGFTSPASFSQTFRSAHGLSPRQYRQQHTTVHAN